MFWDFYPLCSCSKKSLSLFLAHYTCSTKIGNIVNKKFAVNLRFCHMNNKNLQGSSEYLFTLISWVVGKLPENCLASGFFVMNLDCTDWLKMFPGSVDQDTNLTGIIPSTCDERSIFLRSFTHFNFALEEIVLSTKYKKMQKCRLVAGLVSQDYSSKKKNHCHRKRCAGQTKRWVGGGGAVSLPSCWSWEKYRDIHLISSV